MEAQYWLEMVRFAAGVPACDPRLTDHDALQVDKKHR